VVQVGYMKRFDPAVEALLDEFEVPPLHIATATFDPGMRDAFGPPGLPAGAATGDPFCGALVHDVNLVHAALDRCGLAVERVVDGFGGRRLAGGTIALTGGARWSAVWLGLPAAGTFREHVAFYGPDGVRELEFPAPYALHSPTTYRHTAGAITERRSWREAYERQLLHFHACITSGARCRTPAEQGAEDVRLLEAMFTRATA
jgi:predicted dehydrogenase